MKKVLVVEDDRAHLDWSVKLLTGAGYSAVAHNTPLGLPTITEKEKPDLILLDASMPFATAKVLVDSIRKTGAGRKASILLLSDLGRGEMEVMVDETGVDGFVPKAATPTEFIEKADFHSGKGGQRGERGERVNWYDNATLLSVPDGDLQERLAKLFSLLSMRVDIASGEEDTLERVQDNRYCCVVIEPEKDGAEGAALYRKLIRSAPELSGRALFIGASGGAALAKETAKLGCRHLEKLFSSRDFVETINSMRKDSGCKDRRGGLRYIWSSECRIVGLSGIDAVVREISPEGVRVRYQGAPMMKGIVKNVFIKEPSIVRVAEVRWSRPSGNVSEAGLVFTRAVPQSAFVQILPE